MTCEHCQRPTKRLVIHSGELWCTGCHDATKGEITRANGVIPDEIPGGVEIRNGLCNADGTPHRYYSKSEIAREAAKRGLVNHVVHIGSKGSDKSPHTVRWV